jgi:hypothetical protein
MPGESPLQMMQSASRNRRPRGPAPERHRRRRLWPIFVPALAVVLLAAAWSFLWYYAADRAGREIAGWLDREAKVGRLYSCGDQTIGGFPFRIEVRCADPGAQLRSNQPPFDVKAKDVIIAAQVYHPTLLTGEITGPLTFSEPQQPPSIIANWKTAQASVGGLPPEPNRISLVFDKPNVARVAGGQNDTVFLADHAELHSRIVGDSPSQNPVIETVLRLDSASAPKLHPALAQPLQAEITAVLTGLKDLSPRPWRDRFREVQAAGGNVEIKRLHVQQGDIIIVGMGTVKLNDQGRLDGLVRVAIVGIEKLVPLLGVDRAIAQGIDRLSGANKQTAPGLGGLGGLDKLLPGLSDVVVQSASAAIIDNIKKMGQPTEVDKKPAIVLPLNFSDGSVYLGMIPLGQVPSLF